MRPVDEKMNQARGTSARFCAGVILLVLLLLVLPACGASAPQTESRTQVVKMSEGAPTPEEKPVEGEPIQEPAGEEPLATIAPAPSEPEQSPTAGLSPTERPPLPSAIPPTPEPSFAEPRQVELESPGEMSLDETTSVRLSFLPAAQAMTVTVEQPGGQVVTTQVAVKHIDPYQVWAIAALNGIGFDISPANEQNALVTPGEPLEWRWTIRPQQAGQQRLAASLRLRWTLVDEPGRVMRESVIFSKAVSIRVVNLGAVPTESTFSPVPLATAAGAAPAQVPWTWVWLALGALAVFSGWLAWRRAARRRRSPAAPGKAEAWGTAQAQTGPGWTLLELHPQIHLQPAERSLFHTLFERYARVVVEQEFLSGYSGARTFLALPVRPDGRSDAHTIVKISQAEAIQQEYTNYQEFVKDTLPPITARIQQPPVRTGEHGLGALQYTFIGEPGRKPVSLRQALLAEAQPALLERLFELFGPGWWLQRRPQTFRLAAEYDRKLPTHYVLEPVVTGAGAKERVLVLDGRLPPGQAELQVGDLARLEHFARAELRSDGVSLSVEGAPAPGHPPVRVRWLGLPAGGKMPTGAARVVATRWTLLADAVAGFHADRKQLGLPDPLILLPGLLAETVAGTQSVIHGDLNLENVLVGPGDFVWLIDFAQTRQGHPLYDFAHLHVELITHLVAPRAESPQRFLAALAADPLLRAVEAIAARCLFNPMQRREYELALCVACLGALKYPNLDAHTRLMLYLAAARLGELLAPPAA